MPFDFLKRKKGDDEADASGPAGPEPEAVAPSGRGTVFEGYSEEWHLVGQMAVDGRLSDALNKREQIAISDVHWGPIDGSSPMSEAPGLRSIDPYDLIIVIAGEGTLPPMTEAEKNAHRIHKVRYDLALEVPPFKVIGTVYLHPGSSPERLLDRSSEMFLPVVDARAAVSGEAIETSARDVLVNRFYLRGVEQVDISTGERPEPIPGLAPGSPGNVGSFGPEADEGA